MPQGDESKCTDKQNRKAEHIAESHENRGLSDKEAERRAWATVNKEDGGGKKSGAVGKTRGALERARQTKDIGRQTPRTKTRHPRT